jgi:nanoRNase/pAp phosphatase (c-di-AMP/oligoRNAs hydrolase)
MPSSAPDPLTDPALSFPPREAEASAGEAESELARAREFAALLERRRGERHLVALQDYPDPDAIASGMAYREIARCFGVNADLVYDGQISHPENLALINLLEIEIIRFSSDLDLAAYDAAVFVDNQGSTTRLTERLRSAGVATFAVIDHHDPQDILEPVFRDVRPLGAAVSLLTEYLRSGELVRMDPTNGRHVHLGTALMHGLHAETDGFIHAGREEHEAAAYLRRFIDVDLLERVLCVQKSRGTMDVIQAALSRRSIRGGFSVAGVGFVRWGDRDTIPQAADFLLTEENVHTAVVFGILRSDEGAEIVSGSLRTSNPTLGVDSFLKRALGTARDGRPHGGGRARAGGFEIDLGFLSGGEDDRAELKWKLYDRQIREKIFRAAGVEDTGGGGDGGASREERGEG